MMMEEAVKLRKELARGYIKLKEPNAVADTKDRIVATEYGNYYMELLELKMIKDSQSTSFDVDKWSCLAM